MDLQPCFVFCCRMQAGGVPTSQGSLSHLLFFSLCALQAQFVDKGADGRSSHANERFAMS